MSLHFLHIHKTGGTSFSRSIESVLKKSQICPINFEFQFLLNSNDKIKNIEKYKIMEKINSYKFFSGHFGLQIKEKFFEDAETIVLIRDPVERLLSCFLFWKYQKNKIKHSLNLKLHNLSFEEFVFSNDKEIISSTHNVQIRLLAGASFGKKPLARTQVIGPNIDKDKIKSLAKNFLDKNPLNARTNSMNLILEKVSDILGKKIEPNRFRERETNHELKKSIKLSQKILDRIYQINKLDYYLFNLVK